MSDRDTRKGFSYNKALKYTLGSAVILGSIYQAYKYSQLPKTIFSDASVQTQNHFALTQIGTQTENPPPNTVSIGVQKDEDRIKNFSENIETQTSFDYIPNDENIIFT